MTTKAQIDDAKKQANKEYAKGSFETARMYSAYARRLQENRNRIERYMKKHGYQYW